MRVYRLEFRNAKHNGPFNPPMSMAQAMGIAPQEIAPADAAQVAAVLEGKKGPFLMPGILQDGQTVEGISRFQTKAHIDKDNMVFGFSSLEQYRQWFASPAQRRALFLNVAKARRVGVRSPKFNELELRQFDVPDDHVLVAPHQVVFDIEAAVHSKAISRKAAMA